MLLANRQKIFRYLFIPQFLAAAVFLSFSYGTGKVHARLLLKSARTNGTIVDFRSALISHRSGSSRSYWSTIYEPLIEFTANGRVFRVQEWKGSESRIGLGSSVPILYDPEDPSVAMMDRGPSNWLPWAPCFVIGLILALACFQGLILFLFQRNPEPTPDAQTPSVSSLLTAFFSVRARCLCGSLFFLCDLGTRPLCSLC